MAQERQTFAFQVQQPAQQTLPGAQGYQGGTLQGGNTTAVDQSGLGPDNRGMAVGGFLDGLLEPFAARRAKEKFVQGMTDQMYADAGEEIRAGNGLITQVFGPTNYEEGAMFYEAQTKLSQAQAEWSADEDNLKKLNSADVAKAWADRLESIKTGDKFLDAMLEDGMMKQSAPMLQSVAKARYAYKQDLANKAQGQSWSAGGDALQAVAESFAATSAPGDDDIAGYNAAAQTFLQQFAPISGQTDEAYKKNIQGALRGFVSKGNGHAASLLLRSGVLDVFDEGERVKLQDLYDRYGKAAIAKASVGMQDKIMALDIKIMQGGLSPKEAVDAKRQINEEMRRKTGFDTDYYDTSDIAGTARAVVSEVQRKAERAEDMAGRIADREDQQAHEREMELGKAQVDANLANAALASSNPYESLARSGGKMDNLQQAIYNAYTGGDFVALGRAFRSGVPANTGIRDSIQNTIGAQVSAFNPKEFAGVVQKFTGMMQANPAIAKEYFGSAFGPMRQYQKNIQSGASPQMAFTSAFGSDSQYVPSGQQVAAANKAIKTWVGENVQPGVIQRAFGGYKIAPSGANAIANAIAREVAADKLGGNADLDDATLYKVGLERAKTNGIIEGYGPLYWTNAPGTVPISRSLGVPEDVATKVIVQQIDVSLRNRGYKDGINGADYRVQRTVVAGKPAIQVVPIDSEGNMKFGMGAMITQGQLLAAVANRNNRIVSENAPTPSVRPAPSPVARPKAVAPKPAPKRPAPAAPKPAPAANPALEAVRKKGREAAAAQNKREVAAAKRAPTVGKQLGEAAKALGLTSVNEAGKRAQARVKAATRRPDPRRVKPFGE